MILAESLFGQMAEALGIPSPIIEGGVAGLLAFVLAYMVVILFIKEKEDVKQVGLSSQLATLVATSLDGLKALKTALEENTGVLKDVKGVIKDFSDTVNAQVILNRDSIEQVRRELLSNKKTKVVVKDRAGEIIAEMQAEPAVDESGESYLLVQLDLKPPKKEENVAPSSSVL